MFFKKTKKKRREKTLDWMSVICKDCSTEQYIHIMHVNQNAIQMRDTGYKGKLQFFVNCDKCGREIILEEEALPRRIRNFLWAKVYQNQD